MSPAHNAAMSEAIPLSRRTFKGYGIELRPVVPADLPSLRRWRNSPKIRDQMLDRSRICARKQRLWYESIQTRADQAHWTVWRRRTRTGYVNIKAAGPIELQSRVDVGLYVGDSAVRDPFLGFAMTLLQLDIVFDVLGLDGNEVLVKDDPGLIRFNREFGYRELGRRDGFVRLALDPAEYRTARARLIKNFFSRDSV